MDSRFISFAVSKTGASHLPKGTPCQDYSIEWSSEDNANSLIIVCDGHGSSTYVRSDVGSRLAAEIAKENIIKFISTVNPLLFINQKGAVTARPSLDRNSWNLTKETSDTKSGTQQGKQDQLFYKQIQEIKEEIDSSIFGMFEEIHRQWLNEIKADSENNPFSDTEKTALGNNNLTKAYGTTLMAFVRTPYYWLSFHIGDGRIAIADRNMNWSCPVPWDENCFLNYTTSLCGSNALQTFRYAFDGTGNFPVVVMCCSDGVEDSYGDFDLMPQYLHNFYYGLIHVLKEEGLESMMSQLEEFLPKLSAKGSKDDMSLAAIVDIANIDCGLEAYGIRKRRDTLNTEHYEREKRLKKTEEMLKKAQQELEDQKQRRTLFEEKKKNILDRISDFLNMIDSLRSEEECEKENVIKCEEEISKLTGIVEEMTEAFNAEVERHKEEDKIAKCEKVELKHRHDELETLAAEQEDTARNHWEELVSKLQSSNELQIAEETSNQDN